MNNKSGFHRHSIGIVAKDKEEDGYVIEVFPIESQTHTDGDIDKTYIDKVFNKDIHGNTKNIVLNKRVTLKATWMPFGDSNRSTAPNVKKGEQIQVYRYANTDDFYWDTIYNEFDLRRKEKIIHLYGNTDNFKEMLTTSNTYWKKMDTINKIVQFHTCDNDGELTTYDVTLDTKQGVLTVSDGRGNYIKLESAKDKLTTNINEDVEINTKRVLINASESYTVNTKAHTINASDTSVCNTKRVLINASESYIANTKAHTINASESYIANTKAHTINASDTSVCNTGTQVIKATSTVLDSKLTVSKNAVFNSQVGVVGNLKTGSNMGIGGNLVIGGTTSKGSVSVSPGSIPTTDSNGNVTNPTTTPTEPVMSTNPDGTPSTVPASVAYSSSVVFDLMDTPVQYKSNISVVTADDVPLYYPSSSEQVEQNNDGSAPTYTPLSSNDDSLEQRSPMESAMDALSIGQSNWNENGQNPNIEALWNEIGYNGANFADETAWCAVFVGACLKRSGNKYIKTASSQAYKNYGVEVPSLEEAQKGDIVVFYRKGTNSGLGHIGFYTGNMTSTKVEILGGNQGNTLKVSSYDKSNPAKGWGIRSIRRAVSASDGTTPAPAATSDAGTATPDSGQVT